MVKHITIYIQGITCIKQEQLLVFQYGKTDVNLLTSNFCRTFAADFESVSKAYESGTIFNNNYNYINHGN